MKPFTVITRRKFLAGSGGLVFAFSITGTFSPSASQPAGRLPGSLAATSKLDSWIRIDPDGSVTVFSGKVELGQGLKTALVQITADELDVKLGQINLITADTGRTPDEGGTIGSRSIEQSGMAIRQAAAEVRSILLDLAAKRLDSEAGGLIVEDGRITDPATGRETSYGELVENRTFNRRASGKVATKTPDQYKYVGKPIPRIDIPGKVFGEPSYVHDLRLPGMLHGRIVRPPGYGSRLKSLGETALRDLNGVVKVVRDGSFLGVITEREERAVTAAEILRRNSEWSDPVIQMSPANLERDLRRLASKDTVVAEQRNSVGGARPFRYLEASFFRPYQAHASIGPSAAVAVFEDDQLKVWTHSQAIYPLRAALAEIADISESHIRLIHMEGAGCYGHNGADDAAADAVLLARAVPGRPVRVQWMRQDEFLWEPFGSAMSIDIRAGLDEEGRVVDWIGDVWSCSHTTRPNGRAGNLIAAWHLARPLDKPSPGNIPMPTGGLERNADPLYAFPSRRITEHFIPEMPVRVSALRSLGAYANVFAIESFIDELALAADTDPVTFRLRHLNDPRARAVIGMAAKRFGWRAGNRAQSGRGQGFAFARYKNSASYMAIAVELTVDRKTGEVRVLRAVAAVDTGQIINPDGVINQIEGGIIQSTSWTLKEQVSFENGYITSRDWSGYPILGIAEAPEIVIELIGHPDKRPLGCGETAQGPTAAAIANAFSDATGRRLRSLPFTPDRVMAALG